MPKAILWRWFDRIAGFEVTLGEVWPCIPSAGAANVTRLGQRYIMSSVHIQNTRGVGLNKALPTQ